ncbi:hypothetical protein [Desulfobacter curvatus]|uniref:hypothetical protein n=1 Tax=Desulfobacter curvatus TaxID=2290 RepID=UPI0003713652|nr:hypothetical protein [Desulfobacter curvatus]
MEKFTSKIRIHYDGDITDNHQIPMRVLGQTFLYIQKAVDRAYLDLKYKGVWKYARMSKDDYDVTKYLVQAPKEGGYIVNFFSRNKKSPEIADRVSNAIDQAVNQADEYKDSLNNQVEDRKRQVRNKIIRPRQFQDVVDQPTQEIKRKYGDRSIAKEIDQVLSIIRAEYSGDSSLELSLTGSSTQTFNFDKPKSERFHKAVAGRQVGPPVIYRGKMLALDKRNRTGKFENTENKRVSVIYFNNENDFLKAHPYLGNEDEMKFIGAPLVEFGALEPNSGDIYFLYLVNECDVG